MDKCGQWIMALIGVFCFAELHHEKSADGIQSTVQQSIDRFGNTRNRNTLVIEELNTKNRLKPYMPYLGLKSDHATESLIQLVIITTLKISQSDGNYFTHDVSQEYKRYH